MFLRKNIFLFFLIIQTVNHVYAQDSRQDTMHVKKSWYVLPALSYQPETNLAFGFAGANYFESSDLNRISSISYSAMYTLRNQFIINVSPKIYFGQSKQFYMYSNIGYRLYPDVYYGRGGKWSGLKLKYTSHKFYLNLQPQYEVNTNFYVGLMLSFRYEHVYVNDAMSHRMVDSVKTHVAPYGWEPYFQSHIGCLLAYDSRNNHFYPDKGLFAKVTAAYSPHLLSTYSFGMFSLDYRHYLNICCNQVLAWQMYADGVLGEKIPFALFPTLGGTDVMRGFRRGVYSDDFSFASQVEYRIPLFWRLKTTAFCAVGDVLSWENPHVGRLKFAYGLGLRCRLNDARVHLRFDVAKNNYEKGMQFYVTASEAF